ncbi:ABC transporter substrate-binding protein [Hoeflea sp. CAU 1731]
MKKLLFNTAVALGLTLMAVAPNAAQAQSDDTFSIATPIEPDTLDALKTRLPPLVLGTMTNINEPLIAADANGDPVPGMADWTILEDGKVIEFKIKPGVKFHNGDPLTAEDIKFSQERQAELNKFYARQMASFDHIEIVDDQTIRFVFKEPTPGFLRQRSLLIASKKHFDEAGEEVFTQNPIGTGPYKFAGYKFGEYIDLEAFDDYWDGAPEIKKARIEFIKDDQTRVAKLRSGEADLIMHAPMESVKPLEGDGYKTSGVPVHPTLAVYFHTLNPKAPWSDIRVRQAISKAIDGNAIVDGLLGGVPNRFPALGPDEIGYDPDLKLPEFDPAAAKQLLADAGYPDGFTMPMYYMSGGYSGIKETAEAIALFLKPIGIDVELQGLDQLKSVEMLRELHNNPDAMMVGLHPLTIASTPEAAYSIGLSFATSSPFSIHNQEGVTEPIVKGRVTMDDEERGELIREGIRALYDNVIYIPMWSSVSVFAMKPEVSYQGIPRTSGGAWLRINDIEVGQ